MIKILHTADWHIGDFSGPVADGQNVRAKDTLNCIEEVVEAAREEHPDITLISGDVFHQAKVWGSRALDEVGSAISAIEEISDASDKVIVLRGTPNHDGFEQFDMLCQYFSNYPNVEIVMEPMVVPCKGIDVACIPGFDRGTFRADHPGLSKEDEDLVITDELSTICLGLKAQCNDKKPAVLIAHYTVPGCNSESGQSTFLQNFEPILPTDTLAAADYDLICLGHIHRPQKLPNVKNCFYSGAVNAMNFNDEGQKRGFWIHEFESAESINSRFIKTNYREFLTIHLDDDEIFQINNGDVELVAANRWTGKIDGKMVRILYDCTLDNNKALNKGCLEKQLLDDGAFHVWESTSEKLSATADKNDFGSKTDPEENLRKWLADKGYEEAETTKLVSKAREIIAEATANSDNALLNGVFEPVSIEVKNYRNYAEESFDFTDISFCTINGQNGAGKSSLFMDAIIDCLYEEPREGDLTGWIRNDEKARSGSIIFTFKIGEQTFRVTRTRARSGKGTLNISEFEDGEWQDRSAEKYKDTQARIVQLLGMDSMTFKSCALIMQDQYGLFLQAPKEDRMVILGNLLGLGIYNTMEDIAWKTAKQFGAKMRDAKNEISVHDATIRAYGQPKEDLAKEKDFLEWREGRLKAHNAEKEDCIRELRTAEAAMEETQKLLSKLKEQGEKLGKLIETKTELIKIIDDCNRVLETEDLIILRAERYKALNALSIRLQNEVQMYERLKIEYESKLDSCKQLAVSIHDKENQVVEISANLNIYDESEILETVEKSKEYKLIKAEYDELSELAVKYSEAAACRNKAISDKDQVKNRYENLFYGLAKEEEFLTRQANILNDSGCVDIEHAACAFLKDAIEAKNKKSLFDDKKQKMIAEYQEELAMAEAKCAEAQKVLDDIPYDAAYKISLLEKLNLLKPYVKKAEVIAEAQKHVAVMQANIKSLQLNIAEQKKMLDMANSEADRVMCELKKYESAQTEASEARAEMETLFTWVETEKNLPVLKERFKNAKARLEETKQAINILDIDMQETRIQLQAADNSSTRINEIKEKLNEVNVLVSTEESAIKSIQINIGALEQKLKDVNRIQIMINDLQEQITEYAQETADYDTLKAAFSQDGIPHQIIRSIVPQLTDTANSILGQMTNGKMGIEFKTEKTLKSNSNKEVVTLDIMIVEYGKATLPYLSKSGGEKVKASLSVILALAEMKSSAAGIQLGMLFIDEPPFLDADGIQAYCDALETIQFRYPDLKIMAITHDPTMKARFPQSLDIVKTEQGSKVIY